MENRVPSLRSPALESVNAQAKAPTSLNQTVQKSDVLDHKLATNNAVPFQISGTNISLQMACLF